MRPKLDAHPASDRWLQFEGTSVTVAFAMTEDAGERIRYAWNATRGLELWPRLDLEAVLRSALPVIEDAEQAVLLQVVGAAPDIQARLRDAARRYRAQADEIRAIINLPRQ